MKVRSNLYDTFKVRYSGKREAVVKFDAFVALLTIFGAIWYGVQFHTVLKKMQ